ncbi:TRAP transporter small permease [Aquamicrobium sp. LC103]|uniref:TRAP transporter small permease n=1 Tax=Aquamicrobium sp. LC103 TaxID=1120658 RepID=UPI00063E8C80|nr:TRAP transporter small permease [Aquamicrobium sp. LC103]TKT82519.1 TRAP transporter small permease [Aquamicrobium sp. LC103]
MADAGRIVRRFLDAIYDLAGALAAFCLVAILVVITLQVAARWLGIPFHGSSEYAGYFMAAASFLAFAHTLNRGGHIRVGLLLNALGVRRFWGELWCLVIASLATSYLAWYAVRTVYWSWRLNDVSQGQDATPLWMAQAPMAAGAVILAVCFVDNLVTLALTRRDNIHAELSAETRTE